jgi:hypothetical protein
MVTPQICLRRAIADEHQLAGQSEDGGNRQADGRRSSCPKD